MDVTKLITALFPDVAEPNHCAKLTQCCVLVKSQYNWKKKGNNDKKIKER